MLPRLVVTLLALCLTGGMTGWMTGGQTGSLQAQVVNDSNTPLHLMKPAYSTRYGVSTTEEVRQVMDRVLHYLEAATPAMLENKLTGQAVSVDAIDENSQLRRGDFRLTSYEWGVTYSAMLAAYVATGDTAYQRYAYDRMSLLAKAAPRFDVLRREGKEIDKLMRMVVDPHSLDDAGAVCAAMIKAELQDSSLHLDWPVRSYASFIVNRQYRLDDGTFARLRPHYNTVWLDDMFMGIPALAWLGRLTGDTHLYDEAVEQVRLFASRMFVPETGLFRHGWVEAMVPHPAFHWGRANGWAILTLCEVLDALPASYEGRDEITDLLRMHIDALARRQGVNGYWHQLLDRPETYEETSCTAIFTYCIAHAINQGWIDAQAYGPVAQLGWHAVEKAVNAHGQVEGVCVGTGMGFDAAFYAYRPVHVMAAHGYGVTLWAGAEMLLLLKKQHPKTNDSAVQFYPEEINTNAPIFSVDGHTNF